MKMMMGRQQAQTTLKKLTDYNMSDNNTMQFPEGIFFKSPKEDRPNFVKGHIELSNGIVEYYNKHKNDQGYVNIDLLESKAGKLYLKLNDFVPTPKED